MLKNRRILSRSVSWTLLVFLLQVPFPGELRGQEVPPRQKDLPDSTIVLGEISVEALKITRPLRDIPGSVSVVAGREITLDDGTSLAGTINAVPGVTMQSGNYATSRIVIRGMGSRTPYNTNRIKSYLNDIPLTGSDGVSAPEEIDLNSLQRIEIVKGPAAALFGPGLGGSINMYTPDYDQYKIRALAQYGTWQTLQTHLSGAIKDEAFSAWGSISQLKSDGYRDNGHYHRTSVLSTAQWKKSGWIINATFLLTGLNAGIPSSLGKTMFDENPEAAAPAWKAVSGYKKSDKARAGITVDTQISEKMVNHFTIFGAWNDSYEKRPFNNLDDNSSGFGIRENLTFSAPKSEWVLGGEYVNDRYGWQLDKDDLLLNHNSETRNHFNIYGMASFRPGKKFSMTAAAALGTTFYKLNDLFISNGDQSAQRKFPPVVSPRIGINYSVNETAALYASAGHGYSLPSPEETLLPGGDVNPGIEPEQGMQYDTGIRMTLLDNSAWLDATVYWIELKNLLVTKRVTEDIFTGINAGKTRHQGFELMFRNYFLRHSSFPGKLVSNFSYTLSVNKFIDFKDEGHTYDGNNLPGIPRQTIQHQLLWYPYSRMEIATHLYYSGEQFLDDQNSMKYDNYLLANLRISFDAAIVGSGLLQLYSGLNNLTNAHYASMLVVNVKGFGSAEPRYYYPGLPRNIYLGIQYRW